MSYEDQKRVALIAHLGHDGSSSDLEKEWLVSITGAGNDTSLPDLWKLWFNLKGYVFKSNLTNLKAFLFASGFTGSISDAYGAAWEAGAFFGPLGSGILLETGTDYLLVEDGNFLILE